MNFTRLSTEPPELLPRWKLLFASTVAASGYWITFARTETAAAILLALPCMLLLARVRTSRQSFYLGLAVGIAMYSPPLLFFFRVFGPGACALYIIAGLPIAIFVLLLHHARKSVREPWLIVLTPVLWTGVEYFRSELYMLRFAWLLPGQAVAFVPGIRLLGIGVYGLGFVLVWVAACVVARRRSVKLIGCIAAASLVTLMYWPPQSLSAQGGALHVAGVQLEFSSTESAAAALNRLALVHPEAQILVLSEYSFDGPIPEQVRAVLRKHHRYLVAGGTRIVANGKYYDTAFVVGPDGTDLFEQAKSVPVQFLQDGLPAENRRVWNSPWGKIGIAICYDLSYARVIDDFVRQGAQGLIIPTEDAQSWGEYERRMLHGRMAPVRSAEYGIPTFGVWSSGVSQLTDSVGHVIATAGYPGQGEMIAGPFDLRSPGQIPLDRQLAIASTALTATFVSILVLSLAKQKWSKLLSDISPDSTF